MPIMLMLVLLLVFALPVMSADRPTNEGISPDWDVLQSAPTMDHANGDFTVAPRPVNVSGDAESILVKVTNDHNITDNIGAGSGDARYVTLPFEVGWRDIRPSI